MSEQNDLSDIPSDQDLNAGEIQELLSFDPFAETKETVGDGSDGAAAAAAANENATSSETPDASATPADDGPAPADTSADETADATGAATADSATGEPGAEELPAEAAPAAATAPAEPSALDRALGLIEQQNAQIAQLVQAQAAAAKPAEEEPKEPEIPAYEYDIPDAILDGLTGDDRALQKASLASIVKGTAQAVHQAMREEFNPRFEQLPQQIQTTVQGQASNANMWQDFYGTYPALNDPALKSFVTQAAQEVVDAQGFQSGWTPQLRDSIAQRAIATIQAKFGAFQPGAPVPPATPSTGTQQGRAPAAQPGRAGQPPKQRAPNSRPGVSNGDDVATEIGRMMFGQ